MTFFDRSLLRLAPAGVPSGEDPIVIVELGQTETEFEPRAGQNLLERRDARLTVPALDPGDLGLADARPFGQFPLRQAGFEPCHLKERTGGSRRGLDHAAMIVDQLSDVTVG